MPAQQGASKISAEDSTLCEGQSKIPEISCRQKIALYSRRSDHSFLWFQWPEKKTQEGERGRKDGERDLGDEEQERGKGGRGPVAMAVVSLAWVVAGGSGSGTEC